MSGEWAALAAPPLAITFLATLTLSLLATGHVLQRPPRRFAAGLAHYRPARLQRRGAARRRFLRTRPRAGLMARRSRRLVAGAALCDSGRRGRHRHDFPARRRHGVPGSPATRSRPHRQRARLAVV